MVIYGDFLIINLIAQHAKSNWDSCAVDRLFEHIECAGRQKQRHRFTPWLVSSRKSGNSIQKSGGPNQYYIILDAKKIRCPVYALAIKHISTMPPRFTTSGGAGQKSPSQQCFVDSSDCWILQERFAEVLSPAETECRRRWISSLRHTKILGGGWFVSFTPAYVRWLFLLVFCIKA